MNYYNEWDKDAAEWLRELIKARLIPPGVIDTRSISEVKPHDLKDFTSCHFFAGIGGWPYALRLAGIPDDTPVWTGSPPCQPFSVAGSQIGFDDPRHLAPVFLDLIAECRPSIVFGEQVAAAISKHWLDFIFLDMEAEGYTCASAVLPACGVGAPHKRDRLFFCAADMAHGFGTRFQRRVSWGSDTKREAVDGYTRRNGTAGELVYPGRVGRSGRPDSPERVFADGKIAGWTQGINGQQFFGAAGTDQLVNAAIARQFGVTSAAFEEGQQSRSEQNGFVSVRSGGRDVSAIQHTADMGSNGVADSHDHRQQSSRGSGRGGTGPAARNDAGGCCPPCRISDTVNGAGQPEITRPIVGELSEIDGTLQAGINPTHSDNGFWSGADWLGCKDGNFRPVEPGTFPLANGVPARVGRLRGYGNAIVPQMAAEYIQATLAAVWDVKCKL